MSRWKNITSHKQLTKSYVSRLLNKINNYTSTIADLQFQVFRKNEEIKIWNEKNIRQFAMIEELRSQIEKHFQLLERINKK